MTSRNWQFTWFEIDKTPPSIDDKIKYIIYQKEMAPETGKEHFQGYLQLFKVQRLSWLKKNISKTAHFELARGTPEENIAYCTKPESRISEAVIQGVPTSQGERLDIQTVIEKIKLKRPREEYEDTSTYVMHKNKFDAYEQMKQQPRHFVPEVTWLYGPAGTGKSRYPYDKHPSVFTCGSIKCRWDGYNNEEVVLIDDFRPQEWDYQDLLRLLDRYPLTLNVKFGYKIFNSKIIYITSPQSPESYYEHSSDDYEQLKRRITKVINLKKNN